MAPTGSLCCRASVGISTSCWVASPVGSAACTSGCCRLGLSISPQNWTQRKHTTHSTQPHAMQEFWHQLVNMQWEFYLRGLWGRQSGGNDPVLSSSVPEGQCQSCDQAGKQWWPSELLTVWSHSTVYQTLCFREGFVLWQFEDFLILLARIFVWGEDWHVSLRK